ncbi:MAG: hypothetical protein WKF71_17885 [Pyrinomonadaceae bacterium]
MYVLKRSAIVASCGFFSLYWSKIHSSAERFPSLYSQASAGMPVNVVCESISIVPFILSARSFVFGLDDKRFVFRFRLIAE